MRLAFAIVALCVLLAPPILAQEDGASPDRALRLSDRAVEAPGGEGAGSLHARAVGVARSAARQNPGSGRAHSILAVVLGRYADWLAHERRLAAAATVVELGREAHRHALRAIELDREQWIAWAFLGVMHRRLATVPRLVRVVARTFLDWPDVSLEQSERYLARAVRIEPNEVTTRLELARTYLAMGREADARRQLEASLVLEPRDRLDRDHHAAARRLLEEID
ncbi:MAG: hypothetical protein R3326_00620 [Gemmatimonadota bacterium]|nr:hypothetical protein [Gemmatimonadota bacterium]